MNAGAPDINADRLWADIVETARFGGTPDGGVRRLTLSPEDAAVRIWLEDQARDLGATVSRDRLGTIFIRREGRNPDLAPIAMGSHLDTQPTGGKYDGILGVLAGLEVLRSLKEASVETDHPLLLINWTNEEGARFAPAMLCSGAHAGVFSMEHVLTRKDRDGVSFADALSAIDAPGDVTVGATKMAAMFELHIEQGPILEAEEKTIGIVTGAQGARWFDIRLTGRAVHAGSTPMDMRQDALTAAARIITALPDLALRHGGYATVGEISITTPSRNVVPGEVTCSLDIRHVEEAGLDAIEAGLRAILDTESNFSPVLTSVWINPPVRFNVTCIRAVRDAAASLGLSAREIVSGAGHDAVYIAKVAPTAMIFVPCKDGISHNPAESANKDDCANGARVLLQAILRADRLFGP